MAVRLFDSHGHYTDERICDDALIKEIFSGGVERILVPSSDLADSEAAVAIAERYDGMFAAVGIHPHEVEKAPPLSEAEDKLSALLRHPKAVAIGETGLDYYYGAETKELQSVYFDMQLSLAEKTGYPIIVHDRDAHGDTLDAVKAHRKARGVLHSCSCSAETVKEYLRLGWFISFSGVITFKNANRILESLAAVPLDRLLIETDCPYLAPVPMRGKTNHSGYLKYTAARAAEVLGVDTDTLAEATYKNACALFGIDP